MNGIRRTFSFRKKKKTSEAVDGSKPQHWLDDEVKIKESSCSFPVKYLGNIEVYESRGMQVCEEAIKALRKSKKKPQKAILYVSGDALRVSDDVSQHLIVDQTIEKVSFCAPDRSHDKGFAYICRDGATRRWMCHAFLAIKDSGERLSHAVGCAFAICLEKKQKRERDALQLASSEDRSFSRVGSFRPTSLVERLIDPQSAIVVEPVTNSGDEKTHSSTTVHSNVTSIAAPNTAMVKPPSAATRSPSSPSQVTGAIPRPRPSPSILERQGSLRLFPKLQATSPFKRDLSLRLEQLPSNLQRLTRIANGDAIPEEGGTESEDLFATSCSVSEGPTSVPPNPSTVQPAVLKQVSPTSTPLPLFANPQCSPNVPKNFPVPTTTITSVSSMHSIASIQTPSPVPSFPDPFSAAPFNPASIQQQCQVLPVNTWSEMDALSNRFHSANLAAACPVDPNTLQTTNTSVSSVSTPTSPFLGGPPIAAPMSTPFTPGLWPNSASLMRYSTLRTSYTPADVQVSAADPYARFAMSGYGTGYPTAGNSLSWLSSGQSATTWSSPLPSLLPPEPDRLTDPFDVRWAERATSSTTMSTHKPGNPFLSEEPSVTDSSCFQLNGKSSSPHTDSLVS